MESLSTFEKLQSASDAGHAKSLRHLTPGSYEVNRFKTLNTKYGKRLIVRIDKTEYFLPQRFAEAVEGPEALRELNLRRYIMIYGGMEKAKHNRIKVEFIESPLQDSGHDAVEFGMDTIE